MLVDEEHCCAFLAWWSPFHIDTLDIDIVDCGCKILEVRPLQVRSSVRLAYLDGYAQAGFWCLGHLERYYTWWSCCRDR